MLGQTRNSELVPRPRHSNKVCEWPDLIEIFPLQNLRDSVGTGDEKQICIGVGVANVTQGVDCVCRPVSIYINATDRASRICSCRNYGHQIPVFTRGDFVFHPRFARGDKDYFVEVKLLLHLAGGYEVTIVDGVESAAHDANACTALCERDHVRNLVACSV